MKNPKAPSRAKSKLGDDTLPEVQEFMDKHDAFFKQEDATMAEIESIIEQAFAAAEKYKIERAVFLRGLILAIQHMNKRQVDLKNKIATWTQRLAQLVGVAAVGALLLFSGQLYFSSLHSPQEVAAPNFPMSLVG
ncbi:MAG TPA: hypothetical protein VMR46_03430 [Candidatus Paceibacterota bacterium]|nr:hypothetical protein [Candidatus Paceibacterota bacterium]